MASTQGEPDRGILEGLKAIQMERGCKGGRAEPPWCLQIAYHG